MAEQPEEGAGTPEAGSPQPENETSITDLMAQLDEIKRVQSGSDKKVKELSEALTRERAEKEELQTEGMNEKERAKHELERSKQEVAEAKAEIARDKLELTKARVVSELDVPRTLAEYITGKDQAEMTVNAKTLMDSFKAEVLNETNKRLVDSGETPPSGDPVETTPRDEAAIMAVFKKAWAMDPGPEKELALEKANEAMASGNTA